MSYLVQTERFEGPLGLLLHLIRKEEMDVFDINIHQITKQYLDYIRAMKQLDLEVAGEFVAMAATLIHIKSRMLLPQYNEEGELEESDDPRKELVSRLLEYQKFQEVAAQLYERPLLGRDIFLKGRRETIDVIETDEVVVEEDNALFALIASYRYAIKNMKKAVHKVGSELQSIAERILEIKEVLRVGVRMRFAELLNTSGSQREQVLVTFLSLLELAKMGFVGLFQNDSYSEIHIEAKKQLDGDVISTVEDYEHNVHDEIDFDAIAAAPKVDLGDDEEDEIESEGSDGQQDLFSAATEQAEESQLEEEMASDSEIEAEMLAIDQESGQQQAELDGSQQELAVEAYSMSEDLAEETALEASAEVQVPLSNSDLESSGEEAELQPVGLPGEVQAGTEVVDAVIEKFVADVPIKQESATDEEIEEELAKIRDEEGQSRESEV
ncbi:MAG: segregation/condensation protein A [Bdellovibrionales bacterium]|nr:segregation/condensation protein A [Bdellovibrionales bacterium]